MTPRWQIFSYFFHNASNSPLLPIHAEAFVVVYVDILSPSSSLISYLLHGVGVLQYIDDETLDSTFSTDSNDRGN